MTLTLKGLPGKRIHFVGIGGSGMSGLARIAISHNIKVSGSDVSDSSVLSALRALGAEIFIGHDAKNVNGADLIVFSNAIKSDNPERKCGSELGIPEITRAKALALLLQLPERTERPPLHRWQQWPCKAQALIHLLLSEEC
jgi:UDP-N-acetylmuramate--alanine ligase